MLLTHELKTHLRRNADISEQRELDHKAVVKLFKTPSGGLHFCRKRIIKSAAHDVLELNSLIIKL